VGKRGLLAQERGEFERQRIIEALRDSDGEIGPAAEALGISRRWLEVKMLRLGLRELAAGMRARAGIPGPRR
jgi:transcriptional regulator with GAF, ATPase, and Fis domain